MTRSKRSARATSNPLLAGLKLIGAMGLALVAAAFSTSALADYPKRPVSMVIPYGPGGATDISARTLTAPLGKLSPKPLLMVNKTGARVVRRARLP